MKKINYSFIILMIFFLPTCVSAASLSLRASSNSITKGDTVSITATISDSSAIFFTEGTLTCSGGGVNDNKSLSWDNTDNSKKSQSFKLNITSSQIGIITCKTSGVKYTGGSSGGWTNIDNRVITIKVNKPREKSNNNNLKGLSIDNATLTPDFNKDTLEYRVDLESSVEKININATKEDGYASVDGAGEKEVAEGENRFEIVVTSETGNKKTYTIIANVVDNNPITQEVDGKKLSLVKRSKSLTKPNDDFVESKVTISDTEIPAFYNEKLNLTLVGLKDEDGKIALYIYDQDKNTYSKYQQFQSSNIIIMSKVPTDIPEGYVKTNIKIDDNTYDVYQSASNKGYSLIYGLNLNTGKTNWYSYHEDEKTLQVYNDKVITELKKDNQEKIDTYKKIVIGLGSLSILLLIIILLLVLKKNKRKSKVSGIDK